MLVDFGLYVDKEGSPGQSCRTIEWEGTAERIAYHAPYVIVFDPQFIEVRHAETGDITQIIHGSSISCLWDGTESALFPHNGIGLTGKSDAIVHGVMNKKPSMPALATQHIFRLIPCLNTSTK